MGETNVNGRNTPLDSVTAAPVAAPPDRKYLLERIDDAAVVQLYADGFASLPVDQKILIWHLYQAALAGRDIYYDQRYAHNLEMRDLLEEIITHRVDRSADLRRGRALHEAVLAQHRSLQQLDGAQVRHEVHTGRARGRRNRGAEGRREVPAETW